MPTISGTMHLSIIKGVAKVPQDANSTEIGLDEINLLDTSGFSCDEYQIKLPGMKSGAVWADSPLTDGRTLIAGALGNVTETIRLTLNSSSIVQLAAMLSKLGRFKQDCNDFWDMFGQIEPVYLKHQVDGEPGPRYALLYDIDIDVETPIDPSQSMRMITLSIEREYGWRGIAPGDNPKHWSYYINNQSQQWRFGNTNLGTGSDHLFYASGIVNRAEIATASAGWLKQNFIDIPAASIPGDLPALLNISVQPTSASAAPTALLIGKRAKPTTGNLSRSTGVNQLSILTFNASDAGVDTDTTLANDAGASKPIGGGTAQRSVTTFVTASMVTRLHWGGNQYPLGLSVAVMRGRYAVFLRARVSAAATCDIQLLIDQGGIGNNLTLLPVTLSDLGGGGTGNSTDWGFVYLGEVTLPINKRTEVGSDGSGVLVTSGAGVLEVKVQASRTSGAGNLYMNDLIFIPIDEGSVRITSNGLVATTHIWNYDNTGYYLHGLTEDFADVINPASSYEHDTPELGGGGMMLTPKVINRLFILAYVESTKRSYITDPTSFQVRVNIVPRWSGLRDI